MLTAGYPRLGNNQDECCRRHRLVSGIISFVALFAINSNQQEMDKDCDDAGDRLGDPHEVLKNNIEPPQEHHGDGGRHGTVQAPGRDMFAIGLHAWLLGGSKLFAWFIETFSCASKLHAWFGFWSKLYAWFGRFARCSLLVCIRTPGETSLF